MKQRKAGYFKIEDVQDIAVTGQPLYLLHFKHISMNLNLVDNILIDNEENNVRVTYRSGLVVNLSFNDFYTLYPNGLEGTALIEMSYDDADIGNVMLGLIWDSIEITNNNYFFVYRLNGERNRVDKTNYLTYVATIGGKFRNSVNIKNTVIDMENFNIVSTYNYIYIASLNRFYFVDNVDLLTNNITRLTISEDVLFSHLDLILKQYAFINRNENDYNSYLTDSRRAYYDTPIIEYTEYTTGDYFNNTDVAGTSDDPVCYVLEVIRGD